MTKVVLDLSRYDDQMILSLWRDGILTKEEVLRELVEHRGVQEWKIILAFRSAS